MYFVKINFGLAMKSIWKLKKTFVIFDGFCKNDPIFGKNIYMEISISFYKPVAVHLNKYSYIISLNKN